ncbi:MAG: HNH endonuclease [Pseudomonadota bacterium]
MFNRPSVRVLRRLLDYCPKTGALVWKSRPRWISKTDAQWRRWNTRYAGKDALTAQNKQGYRHGILLRLPLRAHRVAWAIHTGSWPCGEIDHINGNKADNRFENLRVVSGDANKRNKPLQANNTSGYPGVDRQHNGTWQASIRRYGKMVYSSTHQTVDEAIEARKAAEIEFGFHPNHGRVAHV